LSDRPGTAETPLIAGPPPANPPLLVALLIVVLSLTAPVLFLRAGRPSLWLMSAILALAFAGILAFVSAIEAQAKRRADHAIRARAIISPAGITFLPTPTRQTSRYFSAQHVKHASLLDGALIVTVTDLHPSPGRHVLRFGQLACPRAQLLDAIATLMSSK
jgi:hypothetical protein